ADAYRGDIDLRHAGDRQHEIGHKSQQGEAGCQQDRRDRPDDERRGNVHGVACDAAARSVTSAGLARISTREPLWMRYCPSVTTISPGCSPASTMAVSLLMSPTLTGRFPATLFDPTTKTNGPSGPC